MSIENPELVADIYGLSPEERSEASLLIGGSHAIVKTPAEINDWGRVGTIVFRWGDLEVVNAIQKVHSHKQDDFIFTNSESYLIAAVVLGAVIGDRLHLSHCIKEEEFDPNIYLTPPLTEEVVTVTPDYTILPFEEMAAKEIMDETIASGRPWPYVYGKVPGYYLTVGMTVNIR